MSRDSSVEFPVEIRQPGAEPAGALVLLHGRAVDQHDLFPLIDLLDPERRLVGICPGGPITDLPPGGRHWYAVERVGFPEPQTFASTYAALGALLEELLEQHGIAWNRTVLGGFSQGTVMSFALGLGSGRPRPAGILALSGFIPTVEGWSPDPEMAAGLPVFLSHGARDQIIPIEFARQARQALESLGAQLVYRETEMGHAIDPRLFAELAEWVTRRTEDE